MSFFGRSPATPPAAPKDDHDLATPEEIGQQRRRRLLIVWAGLAAVLIPLVVWGVHPAVHAVKGWQARRLAAEAWRRLEAGDGDGAFAKVQDALSLRHNDPEVMRVTAVLLTRVEHGREALMFWKEIEKIRPLTRDEQRDYALDLLLTGDPAGADKRLALAWPGGAEGTPTDWHLKMQIAARGRDAAAVVPLAKRLLDNPSPPVTERQHFNAALMLLLVNSPGERQRGEVSLRALADGGRSPESLEALLILLKRTSQEIVQSRERRQAVPATSPQDLLDLAARVEQHPRAGTVQQFVAVQARMVAQPERREELLREVTGRYAASKNNEELAALGSWLYAQQDYARLLDVITPERAVGSRALYLLYLDGLGALGRWTDIKRAIEGQRFTLDPVVEQMYLARCATQLRQPEGAGVHWEAALRAAGTNADALLNLGRYAQSDGAAGTAEAAFRAAVKATPEGRPAHEALLGSLEVQGKTRDAREVVKAMRALWPQDAAVRNDEAYLGALLGEDLTADRDAARELIRAEPASLPHRVTLALAELKLGHALTALDALKDVQAEAFQTQPRFQAVRAAVLWATGFEAESNRIAAAIPRERLLPEERQLVAGNPDPGR